MSFKFYEYSKCSTCRNAEKFLKETKSKYVKIDIISTPPSAAELKEMLSFLKSKGKNIKSLFNASGQVYRELKISDLLKTNPPEAELVELLSKNGKLIKRPFLISSNSGTVGFLSDEWKEILS